MARFAVENRAMGDERAIVSATPSQPTLQPPSVVSSPGTAFPAASVMGLGTLSQTWLQGVLTADTVVTLTAFPGGSSGRIFGYQDGTGAHTLTLSDGVNTQPLNISATASDPFRVDIDCPNGIDIFVAVIK